MLKTDRVGNVERVFQKVKCRGAVGRTGHIIIITLSFFILFLFLLVIEKLRIFRNFQGGCAHRRTRKRVIAAVPPPVPTSQRGESQLQYLASMAPRVRPTWLTEGILGTQLKKCG
jgi:hypothetical protein